MTRCNPGDRGSCQFASGMMLNNPQDVRNTRLCGRVLEVMADQACPDRKILRPLKELVLEAGGLAKRQPVRVPKRIEVREISCGA